MAEVLQARRNNLTNVELQLYREMLLVVGIIHRHRQDPVINFHARRMALTLNVLIFAGEHQFTPQGRVFCMQVQEYFDLLIDEFPRIF